MPRTINPAALREIRELAGVGRTELARRCGMARGTLINIELGNAGASEVTIRKLADGLKTSVDAITHLVPDQGEAAVNGAGKAS